MILEDLVGVQGHLLLVWKTEVIFIGISGQDRVDPFRSRALAWLDIFKHHKSSFFLASTSQEL